MGKPIVHDVSIDYTDARRKTSFAEAFGAAYDLARMGDTTTSAIQRDTVMAGLQEEYDDAYLSFEQMREQFPDIKATSPKTARQLYFMQTEAEDRANLQDVIDRTNHSTLAQLAGGLVAGVTDPIDFTVSTLFSFATRFAAPAYKAIDKSRKFRASLQAVRAKNARIPALKKYSEATKDWGTDTIETLERLGVSPSKKSIKGIQATSVVKAERSARAAKEIEEIRAARTALFAEKPETLMKTLSKVTPRSFAQEAAISYGENLAGNAIGEILVAKSRKNFGEEYTASEFMMNVFGATTAMSVLTTSLGKAMQAIGRANFTRLVARADALDSAGKKPAMVLDELDFENIQAHDKVFDSVFKEKFPEVAQHQIDPTLKKKLDDGDITVAQGFEVLDALHKQGVIYEAEIKEFKEALVKSGFDAKKFSLSPDEGVPQTRYSEEQILESDARLKAPESDATYSPQRLKDIELAENVDSVAVDSNGLQTDGKGYNMDRIVEMQQALDKSFKKVTPESGTQGEAKVLSFSPEERRKQIESITKPARYTPGDTEPVYSPLEREVLQYGEEGKKLVDQWNEEAYALAEDIDQMNAFANCMVS